MPETVPLRVHFSLQPVVGEESHPSCAGAEDPIFPTPRQLIFHTGLANHSLSPFSPITSHPSGSIEVPQHFGRARPAVVPISQRRDRLRRGHPTNRSGVAFSTGPSASRTRRKNAGPFASKALKLQITEVEDAPFPPDLTVPNRLVRGHGSTRLSRENRELDLPSHREGLVDRITVLIADSDGLFRQGLRLFLALQEDIQVIGEAASIPQARARAEDFHPDILLLSVEMLRESGLEFLFEIRTKSPKTKVLIFSSANEDNFIVAALQHGAMGYLLKTATQQDLIKAIRMTQAGEIWAERRVLTQVLHCMRLRLRELETRPIEVGEQLTEREREIVPWVIQGMTNKEIALRLGISEKTVKSHLHSIFGKLKVSRRIQLLRLPGDL
jgi:DNA-binding NarL/FixJ family response regulator